MNSYNLVILTPERIDPYLNLSSCIDKEDYDDITKCFNNLIIYQKTDDNHFVHNANINTLVTLENRQCIPWHSWLSEACRRGYKIQGRGIRVISCDFKFRGADHILDLYPFLAKIPSSKGVYPLCDLVRNRAFNIRPTDPEKITLFENLLCLGPSLIQGSINECGDLNNALPLELLARNPYLTEALLPFIKDYFRFEITNMFRRFEMLKDFPPSIISIITTYTIIEFVNINRPIGIPGKTLMQIASEAGNLSFRKIFELV